MEEPVWISDALALAIHNRQIAEHGGKAGLRDATLLSSGLNRARNIFAFECDTVDIARLAAAYLHGIVRNHPFIDGNKRTGLVLCGVFLRLNGFRLVTPLSDLYTLTLTAATGEISEERMADWIRMHTQSG